VLEVADGTLDRAGGFAAGPTDRVERTNRIEDCATDPEDGV